MTDPTPLLYATAAAPPTADAASAIITAAGVRDLLAILAAAFGIFFMFIGAVGVYRFPDAYARMHAASKCTTLGLTGLLIAATLHIWMLDIAGKSLMVVVFTFVATPIGTHLLAKAAHHGRANKYAGTLEDQLEIDKSDPTKAVTHDLIEDPNPTPPNPFAPDPTDIPPPPPPPTGPPAFNNHHHPDNTPATSSATA